MFSQILRYVSDRTGIIALANFPLIWLFGMRNNLLLWMTGWDFGTYNNFHRWVARVSTLQAVIHSLGYTILVLYGRIYLLLGPIYAIGLHHTENGFATFVAYWNEFWWTTGALVRDNLELMIQRNNAKITSLGNYSHVCLVATIALLDAS